MPRSIGVRSLFGFAIVVGLFACGEASPHRAVAPPGSEAPELATAVRPVALLSPSPWGLAGGAPLDVAIEPHGPGAAWSAPAASTLRSSLAAAPAPATGRAPQAAGTGVHAPASQSPFTSSPAPANPGFGALEGASRLKHFFSVLAALESGHSGDDVRILQFGDSHTASDSIPGVYRRQLQARFGDGGRGFVPLGIPWRNYVQDNIRAGMAKEFAAERARPHDGRAARDGDYGLLGVAIATDRPGARAWTQVSAPESRVEIDYLAQPNGGSAEVYVDGAPVGRLQGRAVQREARFFSRDVADAPHQIEVRALGDGAVRLFGMALDRPVAGVVVDALGINGAQIYTPLRWNEPAFAEQLRHRLPDLVVLAYGTNEALDPKLDLADYERSLVELLGRFARAVPNASCLLLGPPDLARRLDSPPGAAVPAAPGGAAAWDRPGWYAWPPLADVIAVQRRVAHAGGCAFFDQRLAMGGPGTMITWAAESDPRAQADRVHFTRSGYTQLATSFSAELLRAYDAWRAGGGAAPSSLASR